ncbi:hypothetical protein EON65_52365 [archaeon]|nr:MAG: hypothetical protein EON65_52365 [archaeon]
MSCIGGLSVGEMVKHWPATDPPPTLMTLNDARQKVMVLLQQALSHTEYSMDEVDCSFYSVDNENKLRDITKSLE